jgi:hypothetical protein
MPTRTGLPKNPRNQPTAPEMPAAKSMRPLGPGARDSGTQPASGEKWVGTASHADFLDAVTNGKVRLIGEEKRRADTSLEPGIRRVQYGAVIGERVALIRWVEDNAGHWQRTELTVTKSAIKALAAALEK